MSKYTRIMGTLFIFSVLVLMGAQILLYRKFAFEATWLLARKATKSITQNEYRKLGAICSELQKTHCGISTYQSILAKNPNDRVALSRLALNLTAAQRYDEAVPYYRAYFAAGGSANDVMKWYSFTLQKLDSTLEQTNNFRLPTGTSENSQGD